jgi:hypothetical protein
MHPRRFLPVSAALLSAAIVVTGCVGASAPAFQGGGEKRKGFGYGKGKSFEAGEVDTAGTYVPSDNEKALDCRRLNGSMHIIVARLKDAHNRPQPGVLASTAQGAISAVSGKPGISMTAEEQRERARLVAFNKLLADKGCPTMDIEAALRPAPLAGKPK